jgi:predicted transcriptional regulator
VIPTGEEATVTLEAAGVGPEEERVYRLLVQAGAADIDHLTEVLRLPSGRVEHLIEDLLSKGLVNPLGGGPRRYAATPPDVGFGPLLLHSQEALDWARRTVTQLTEEHRANSRRHDAAQLIEVITGAEAIRQQLRTLQLGTRSEILWFCRAGHVAMPSADNDEEFAMLARGVSYRVIYERDLLEEPGMIDSLVAGLEAGEVARATPTLPIRLAIADRSIALCPLVAERDDVSEPTAALVRDSSLLTALIALFESYWSAASPLRLPAMSADGRRGLEQLAPTAPISEDERHLLSLLVAGVTDKAIATRLGVSMRTVQRRVSDLMALVHAETRMQLAWQVAGRGWLDASAGVGRAVGGPTTAADLPT